MAWTSVWGVEKLRFDIIPPSRGHRNMPWERKSADTMYSHPRRRPSTAHQRAEGCMHAESTLGRSGSTLYPDWCDLGSIDGYRCLSSAVPGFGAYICATH